MNKPDLDQLLVEIAADVRDAEALEVATAPDNRHAQRIERQRRQAASQSMWQRHHHPSCKSREPGFSAAACTCSESGPLPGPNAKMLAEFRALETCSLCGERAVHVLGGNGYCLRCIKSDDVHAPDCATLATADLLACTCGIRLRLVAERR